jgi:F-type H+-transporting ATPase subunit delta
VAEAATIARPYAKAAFQEARERATLSAWSAALQRAAGLAADPRVVEALTSPKLSNDQFVRFFAGLGGEGIDSHWQNFVRVLATNKRLGLLAEIAAQFEALKADHENRIAVEVVSATPIGPGELAKLTAALVRRLKREVRIDHSVDPALLGGAVIRAGDLVIDGSLTGRLRELATALGS